ncbi:hypothetical protein D3C76_1510580 [compost metagenome]
MVNVAAISLLFMGDVLVLLFTGCRMCLVSGQLEELDHEDPAMDDLSVYRDVYMAWLRCAAWVRGCC